MEWRDIEGFDGRFSISDEGSVRQNWRLFHNPSTGITTRINTNRILAKHNHRLGYKRVHLLGSMYYIHVLVAKAFLPNPNNLPEVNHKDEDRSNNTLSNLEWITHQENCEYSQAVSFTIKSPSQQIVEVRGLSRFCRENGLTRSGIQLVLRGLRTHHKGWTLP